MGLDNSMREKRKKDKWRKKPLPPAKVAGGQRAPR